MGTHERRDLPCPGSPTRGWRKQPASKSPDTSLSSGCHSTCFCARGLQARQCQGGQGKEGQEGQGTHLLQLRSVLSFLISSAAPEAKTSPWKQGSAAGPAQGGCLGGYGALRSTFPSAFRCCCCFFSCRGSPLAGYKVSTRGQNLSPEMCTGHLLCARHWSAAPGNPGVNDGFQPPCLGHTLLLGDVNRFTHSHKTRVTTRVTGYQAPATRQAPGQAFPTYYPTEALQSPLNQVPFPPQR